MAKKINYEKINVTAKTQLEKFIAARVAIAKEDRRYKEIIQPLNKKLEELFKNRENDIAQGMDKDEVLKKYSTVETENKIRKANIEHRENLKPLNADLKTTYKFIPANLYDAYVKKVESGKRGDFLNCMEEFFKNLGIEEVTQSALRATAERISDRLGVMVSNSVKLLSEGKFSSTLNAYQFNKLYMSVFCDILVTEEVLIVEF